MKRKNELGYRDLKITCDPKLLNFNTTDDLEPISTGIGQERGIKALEFGLNVDINGYNVYVEGPYGVGKTAYVKNYLNVISKKKKVPNDWCYLYNFDNPNEPVAVSLPADIVSLQKSVSEALSKNIGELEKYAKTELPQTISSQKSALEGLEQLSKNIKSML